MVYANAPASFKEAMFREAAALGASSIRVDVSVNTIVRGPDARDWSSLDEYVALARRYRLQVVGVLLDPPWWLSSCLTVCPPSDVAAYAGYAGEIAARARGGIDDWEVRNEPDGTWAYRGTAGDYARELIAVSAAIHVANRGARVLLGGVMNLNSRGWLLDVFAAGGPRVRASIDVANVHVRAPLAGLARTMRRWRAFFDGAGVHSPIWVTEFGYPSQPHGESAQAAYLARALPALLAAGAARAFVTERDNLWGAFASEGLLGGTVADPPVADPVIRRKPAALVFARLARGTSASPERDRRGATPRQASAHEVP
jgi:hypothetical protein